MKLIQRVVKFLICLLPKKYIIFESVPDLSDNTRAVFHEMLKRGLNKKYTFIWALQGEKKECFPINKNIKYLKIFEISTYISLRTKAYICCNHFLEPYSDKQFSIYLGHGNPLKDVRHYYCIPDNIKFILCSSKGMQILRQTLFGIKYEKLIPLGYPRNDELTTEKVDLNQIFNQINKKYIIWYPTFRQHKNGWSTGATHSLPIIWDVDRAKELNNFAKDRDVIIILKPHFAQDVSIIKNLTLSNIIFITDDFFIENNFSSYGFVGSGDALLTDYSSIYYDFTLCDKPIGLIWEDYEEYKQNPGFAVDMDYMMKGGAKIYNLEDLKSFVKDVADGVDRLKEERREIRDFANYSTDGKNTKRVVDFIIEKAKI